MMSYFDKIANLNTAKAQNNNGNEYFKLKGLKEKRSKVLKESEQMLDKAKAAGRDLNASEQRKFDENQETFNQLTMEIKQVENQNPGINVAPSRTHWQTKNGEKIRVLNKNESFSNGSPDFSLGQFAQTMVTGKGGTDIKNALQEGTDSAGGFTVPSATLSEFFDKLRAKSRVVQSGARTIMLDTDNTTIARVASSPAVAWHQESQQESDTDLTFEGAVFKPKTLMILVKASREMVSDSANINDVLESVFAGTVGSAVDAGILFGSNSGGQMKGLTSYPIAEVPQDAALTNYDPLVKAYRMMLDNNSTAPTAYLMAPREWETLATLKDSNNRYLDRPQALDGIPFYDTTNIPTDGGTGSNESSIVTGNWNDLVIGLRSEMRIELLRERYADSYEFGFLCHMRVDALPARDESFAQITGITP